ncbi:MAG: cupin domain-containing protein [Thermoplasmata archaeon]|nr:cupin domain-containing protein [Thermoplasmata archaeon]
MKNLVPMVSRMNDMKTEIGADGLLTKFVSTEVWDLGLYFMEPGMTTIVFSTEEKDDGTAEEWYGWSYEFYYIVQGEFTVWYGKKADDLKRKRTPKLVLKEGDVVSYPPNWKYMVQNTGKIPGSFFWGKTAPRKDVKMREIAPSKIIK